MALEDYRPNLVSCSRCSCCKWIPQDQIKSIRFARSCPSIEYSQFQAYSLGGRISVALSLLEGRSGYTEGLKDIVWKCQMDAACDVSDKVCRYNIEGIDVLQEMRFKMVEEGQTLPQHIAMVKSVQKNQNSLFGKKAERGQWAAGLKVKDLSTQKAEVVFHAGCRLSYDKELQKTATTTISLLQQAGIDIGILGQAEMCCGGRLYDIGQKEQFSDCANQTIKAWTKAEVKTVVTSCSHCYRAFKRLYPEMGSKFEVLHTVEFIDRLLKQGKIKFTRSVPLTVTYHDPCNLGRRGEPYVAWQGKRKKIFGQIPVFEPRKPRYNGAWGVYDPPRNILSSIPGVNLVEMERIREYSWCCGAGGGVKEAYPDFAKWTAEERIEEAKTTGAEALVSACPWCERNFIDTLKEKNEKMKVMDIIELVQQAI